jgi:hypothetical protein
MYDVSPVGISQPASSLQSKEVKVMFFIEYRNQEIEKYKIRLEGIESKIQWEMLQHCWVCFMCTWCWWSVLLNEWKEFNVLTNSYELPVLGQWLLIDEH